jgi:hypothetical protein
MRMWGTSPQIKIVAALVFQFGYLNDGSTQCSNVDTGRVPAAASGRLCRHTTYEIVFLRHIMKTDSFVSENAAAQGFHTVSHFGLLTKLFHP